MPQASRVYVVEFFNERTKAWQKYATKFVEQDAVKLAEDIHEETELRTRVQTKHR